MIFRLILRLFMKLCAADVARAAYAGVLCRPADATGLRAYTKKISRTGLLAPVLADFARSREAWDLALTMNAEDLVRRIYGGLSDIEPGPERLQSLTAQFQKDKDIASMMSNIMSSNHCIRVIRNCPSAFVNPAFKALLKRDADPEGFAAYSNLLRETGDLGAMLTAIDRSAEHRDRLLDERLTSPSDQAKPPRVRDVASVVKAAFLAVLGRQPDPEGMATYADFLQTTGDTAHLLDELRNSPEGQQRLLTSDHSLAMSRPTERHAIGTYTRT